MESLEYVETNASWVSLGGISRIPGVEAYVVVVAEAGQLADTTIRAFLAQGNQGVNYHRNTWHGILTPLDYAQSFVVIDRAGKGVNVEEYYFETPFEMVN